MATASFTIQYAALHSASASGRVPVVIQPVGPTASSRPAVTMTITDPVTDHPTEASSFATLTRPGMKPFFFWTGEQLSTATLTCFLEGHGASVESTIAQLRQLKLSQVAVNNYGPLMGGTWWMSDLDIGPQRRQPGTNDVTRAQIKITFTEVSDQVTGPATVLTNP